MFVNTHYNWHNTFPTVTVDVYVEVLSARERSFTVTCTARGGTVLNSSLTGPGVNHTLNLVGAKNMRGDDTYMVTTRPISGGVNGDTYKCVATNGAAVLDSNGEPTDPSDSESLNGKICFSLHYIHSTNPCSCQSPNY